MFGFKRTQSKERSELDTELVAAANFRESLKNTVPYIEFTPEGVILYANEQILAVTGYSLDEVLGKHHSFLCFQKMLKNQITDSYGMTLRMEHLKVADSFARTSKTRLFGWQQLTSLSPHDLAMSNMWQKSQRM